MAKTRIKTTPTRMQKEALMASAAVTTTTTNIVTEHVFKKRISVLKNPITAKELNTQTNTMPLQSTIIVQPPKRTNSISSTTSTISHTSDGNHSYGGDISPPPRNSTSPTQSAGPTMDELTESAIKTLNAGLLAKSNALALKNRKVYMITEKCDESTNGPQKNGCGSGSANGMAPGQKRKMYLIMEEKESNRHGEDNNEKLIKTETGSNSKKLTLFTDNNNGQLPQKFEKILPEILNCIQAKKAVTTAPTNGKPDLITNEVNTKSLLPALISNDITTKFQVKKENNERLPLTLPPKKNRTKIITTQIIPVNPQHQAIYQQQQQNNGIDNWSATNTAATLTGSGVVVAGQLPSAYITTNIGNSNGYCKPEKSSSATPVIVNASTLVTANNGNVGVNGLKTKENGLGNVSVTANQLHKNINLSTDFLFLMKMLPKLESIEEPHKNYVKTCIEDIINQYATSENGEQ